jgi:DNA-binding transcriptional ArsR family regulator
MIERRDVFQAIADPTRRMIIGKLSQGPLNISQIGKDLDMSKQAVAKHIKILRECGMLVTKLKGREQVCEAQLAVLDEVTDWVSQSRKIWNQRFEKLDRFLASTKKQ